MTLLSCPVLIHAVQQDSHTLLAVIVVCKAVRPATVLWWCCIHPPCCAVRSTCWSLTRAQQTSLADTCCCACLDMRSETTPRLALSHVFSPAVPRHCSTFTWPRPRHNQQLVPPPVMTVFLLQQTQQTCRRSSSRPRGNLRRGHVLLTVLSTVATGTSVCLAAARAASVLCWSPRCDGACLLQASALLCGAALCFTSIALLFVCCSQPL